MSLTYQQELSREMNSSRQRDNKVNLEKQKNQLDCIKERIYRKHKKI